MQDTTELALPPNGERRMAYTVDPGGEKEARRAEAYWRSRRRWLRPAVPRPSGDHYVTACLDAGAARELLKLNPGRVSIME